MTEKTKIIQVLRELQQYSEKHQYKGYNKHDGLNSPILRSVLGWGRWPRMVAIQGVMRFPVNIRPLLLVPKTYNPKGLALFAYGFLDLYAHIGHQTDLDEALRLLQLLEDLATQEDYSGLCWGYHYPWQDPGFHAPARMPNAVVSCFVCESFLQAFRQTNNSHYLEVVRSCISQQV